jgi:PAS domain S-box-containing protein
MAASDLFQKLRLNTLRSQLIVSIASVNIVVMTLFIMNLKNRQTDFVINLNHDRGVGLSENLASIATSHVAAYELDGLQTLLKTYRKMPGLNYAMVTSYDGIVLAHTNENFLGLRPIDSISTTLKPVNATQVLVENNSTFDVASPIVSNNKIVGWARIGLSQTYLSSKLTEIRNRGILYILLSLVAGSLLAIIVAERLSKGLKNLVAVAQKIGKGNRDHRATASKSAEVTQLGIAFNQMLDELKRSEEKNRALVENITDAIVLLDVNSQVIYQSPSVERITGYSFEHRTHDETFEFVYKDDVQKVTELVQRSIQEPGVPINYQIRLNHKEGHIIWIDATIMNMLHNESIKALVVTYSDITERKKATELFKYQFENSPDIIVIVNRDHKIESINKDQPGGLPAKELIGKIHYDMLPEQVRHLTREDLIRSFETGQIQEHEIMISNGRWMISRYVPIVIDGEVTYVMVIGTNITARKKAEAQIEEQAETFSAIIENANESIWLLSPDLKVMQYNKTAVERLKFHGGKEIHIGADFREFLYPGTDRVFMPMFNDAIAGKYPEGESYQSNIQGKKFWLRTRMYPVYTKQRKLIGITVLAENITDRKTAEISLVQSEEKNRALIENSSDTIILVNENLELTYQSPSYIRTAGFSMEDHKGKTILEFIHPFDVAKCRKIFEDAKSVPGISIQDQMRLLHKTGDYIWIEGTITNLLENESVNSFVLNYRDITDRKMMEQEREKNLTELLQKNRDLEQFSYSVSHNLRGPLASILGMTGLISTNSLNLNEKEHVIKSIGTSASKLDEVIKDLNSILNIKQGTNESKEDIDFMNLLNDVKFSMREIIEKEQVEIITDFSAIENITSLKSYLYSIFYNLISNSIKYRQNNSRPVIKITSAVAGNKTVLTFWDNGLGMDLSSYGDQVFGLYKRFHPRAEGKGMGLFMVKTQTEAIGGTISVNSEVNKWTEFRIEIAKNPDLVPNLN